MERDPELERRSAVERCHNGDSPSAVAVSLGRSRCWVLKWLERAASGDPEWFRDRPRRPHRSPSRCSVELEQLVLRTRMQLRKEGDFCGAQAIAWELEELGYANLPSVRTIARILARHGAVERREGRYKPKGKAYPAPDATGVGAVQQTDFVGPRYGRAPLRFYSLNTVELATGRCALEPLLSRTASDLLNALWRTWSRLGVPRYQQVDNAAVFYGSPRHPRGMGPLIRLCLSQGVEPIFIPPGEPWRNGVVEKFNDFYEARFFRRVSLENELGLQSESRRFEERHNTRYRYTKLGGSTPLATLKASRAMLRLPSAPEPPKHPLPKPGHGRYHLIRFVRNDRALDIFGERFTAPAEAVHEYVRATVEVEQQKLLIYLEKRLIETHTYAMP